MNEFSCAGSLSIHVAWRASNVNVAKAIRRPNEQVQRHRHLQPRQVRPRERQVRRRRQVYPPAGCEHARALAQVQRRVGDVLDDRVRQHQIERRRPRTAAPCRRPARSAGCGRPRSRAEPHAGVAEPVDRIDADDLTPPLRRATAACRRRRSRRRARGRARATPARSRNAITFALR